LAPQVLSEFVHIVSDERRFARPLTASQALARAELWWHAQEVVQVYPDADSVRLFFDWMRQYRLGRKRLLDTFLAATYFGNGVTSILSTNARDFATFGCFELLTPETS
jgi:predicted nucleic acid-binding protein